MTDLDQAAHGRQMWPRQPAPNPVDEMKAEEPPAKPPIDPQEERKANMEAASTLSKERHDLAEKQAAARKGVTGVELEKMKLDQAEERRLLAEKQASVKTPSGGVVLSYAGLANVEKVAALHADLVALSEEHDFVVGEVSNFGQDLDVFDPESGLVVIAASGAKQGVGHAQPFTLLTADQVVGAIVVARVNQRTKR